MDGTTEHLSMTAAELSFLLASGGPAGEAPRLLGLTDADRADAVLSAGLGSLLLRHLAAPVDGQKLEMAPAVAAVAAGLHHPRAFIQVALTAEDHADGALLFEAEMTRFLVAARAYRCYDITPIGADVDVREPLLAVADRFLHRHRPAVATFNASTAQDVARGTTPARATLASSTDGSWRFVGSDGTGETATVVERFDDAAALMREELARMLPVFQPQP
ncbi:hypothetical protein Daura_36180 [Dactylosporangium aurantiacum]|uniref:Uncharacterized protein n=1 Tax=Dactylosporangium aurantiacum TaxID=35754 RepID=A0A9Q9ICY6_9ACTN|nr:hypothetical protein [Dactylosporangium aurantiacum]MDG6103387.1 hypothetical protein [Dactylosporangium aurantiacum]UWZ52100.1 hypothetical protein Daura_36180 [Dactylosporangium aurantiacum]